MDLSPLQIFSLVFTYLVFGFLGYRLSRKFKRPVTLLTWIELIIATVLAMYVMPNAILIRMFDFEILINHALQAIGVGIIIGLATREIRLKVQEKNSL
jgi:hypothetical protein